MANEFLLNLRAARGNNQNNIPRQLPTRGDMQKQKQKQTSVDPNAFINFLRMASGLAVGLLPLEVDGDKEQLNIEDVPAGNMDRMSPNEARAFMERKHLNGQAAQNGSLRVENDLNKYNAAVNGDMVAPSGRSEFENAYGVLNNYDRLNKLLDDYDAINTWAGKRKFLENSYKNFDDRYGDIRKWFNRLYGYTEEAQQFGEWNTKSVSDVMRQINENVRRNLIREI